MKRALAPVGLLVLAACSGGSDDAQPAPTDIPKAVADQAAAPVVESEYGTPVKDRVATIGLLNKRNNLTQDIELKPGEQKRVDDVLVKLDTCERRPPWDPEPEEGAFVQVFVTPDGDRSNPTWNRIFSGWLFLNSPSLNVVEHPIYDVWIKDCAMIFPGEEGAPAAAEDSKDAKPSGKAT